MKGGHLVIIRKYLLALVVLWGVVLLPHQGPAGSTTMRVLMDMHEPFYVPAVVTVYSGQTIQWYNQSGVPHTITHDSCVRRGHCAFESGPVYPGGQFTVDLLAPGTYSYHCSIHPFMRGRVIVKGSPSRQFHDL